MEIPIQLHEYESEEKLKRSRAEMSRACADDPALNRTRLLWFADSLRKRAETTEACVHKLLQNLTCECKDQNLLEHLALIKKFPEQYEETQIRQDCAMLETQLTDLEEMRNDFITELDSSNSEGEKEILLEDESASVDPPLLKMYGKLNQSEILISLASEVNQLRKEYDVMHKQHKMIQEAFGAVKGEKTWNLLCKCVKEVDHMIHVLNVMTDGQLAKGTIEYVHPNRVDALEVKLRKTDYNLQAMEGTLNRLQNFKIETEALLAKCNPILEQLYIAEQKEDTYAEDLKNATEISNRIGVMEVDVEHMSNIINALMLRLEGRLALIEATVKKMDLLEQAKADKDYVESSLPLMAEKKIVENMATFEEIIKVFNDIGQKLMNCFEKTMKTMTAWNETLEELQLDASYKMNESKFSQLLKSIKKRISAFQSIVRNLEIDHIQERVERCREDRIEFKDLRCVTCDHDAFMNTTTDFGVPLSPPCPFRFHMGPYTAYALHRFREKVEILKSTNNLTESQCFTDVSYEIGQKNKHFWRSRPESGTSIQICTETLQNAPERVVQVVELDDFSSLISQLNSKESKQKFSQVGDKSKNVAEVRSLSS